jgi:hypothetical protein
MSIILCQLYDDLSHAGIKGLILWDDNNSYLLWNYGMVII